MVGKVWWLFKNRTTNAPNEDSFFFPPGSARVQNVLVSHAGRGREQEVRSRAQRGGETEVLSLPVCWSQSCFGHLCRHFLSIFFYFWEGCNPSRGKLDDARRLWPVEKAPENNAGRADELRLLEQRTFRFQFVSKAVLIYISVLTDGDGGFTDGLVCRYRSFMIIRGIRRL